MKLRVFNIQYYSLHDGAGIRTVIFLKGCPLRCRWCCNPESQHPAPELFFSKKKCIGYDICGLCAAACHAGAIKRGADGTLSIDRSRNAGGCTGADGAFPCAAACPSKALEVKGREMTIDEILAAACREEIFYHHGGGGLTLSGGEPLMQGEALVALLREAKRLRLNTAMETCGFGDYALLKEAARYLDALFFDIKSTDEAKHLEWTGASNQKILENYAALRAGFPALSITARTPVIPGFNDTPEELERIRAAAACGAASGCIHELLPYHRLGEWKYEALGRRCLI
ncbi:MAG: glycyl-radical enzyme activating protein [Spirochaetaceae bacterium]|nr:glycyl-radical enzyme activating protein [Spirochaetaceae bacterium]